MNDICLEIYTGKRDLGWDKNASFFLFPCFLTLAKNTVRFVSCNTRYADIISDKQDFQLT